MDGLSVAASVMAVLDLTGKVIKYAKEAKDASAERNRLLRDVINIKGSLHSLQSHVEISDPNEPWMRAVQDLVKPGGPLEVYKAALEHLLEKLSPPYIDGKRALVKRLGASLVWPFQAGEVSEILATIERQQKLFDLALSLDSMALTRAIHADAQDSKRIHRVMTSDLQQARSQIHQILGVSRSETEIKVLESLSTMRPREQHADISSRRAPNTCEWVRGNRAFMDWLQGSGSSNVIWCSGIPGSGKTFVTSMVIDHLGSIANEQDVVTAYVYCDYKAHQKQPDQAPLSIVGALLRQFMSVENRLPSSLIDLYHRNMRDGVAIQMPTLEDLLVDYCRGRSTYIVIDALDESGLPDVRRTLLRLLKRLESTKSRLFFTSRPGQKDIERYLKGRPCIPIEATASDITRFLNGRIDEKVGEEEELEDLLSDELREDIISTLVQRSHGMFLLPDLQIRTVLDQVSTDKIREALVTLPEGLEAQFEASVSRIHRQPKARRDLAIRTIMWVAHAMETVGLGALQHALGVETGDRNLVHSRMTPLSLLKTSVVDFCQGLIIVQQETSQVRLAHFTLFEYFFERRPYDSWYCSSEQLIAETCLTYLLFEDFGSDPPSNDDSHENMLRLYPLYDYAACRWGIHVHRLHHHSPPPLTVDLMYRFVFSSVHLERAVQALSSSVHRGVSPHGYSQIYPKILSPIHVSALFGIPAIAGEALKQCHDIDIAVESQSGYLRGWTALHFAADNTIGDPCGSWMTDTLIESGADCDLRSDRGETPLYIAARNGRTETLKALMNANADMEIANDDGWKPIHAATEYGHLQALTCLLEAGCQVFPKTTHDLVTPLHQAITNRKYEIVELLLRHNARLEATDRHGNAPIHAAARAGQPEVLAKLLEKGASIEAHDNNSLTPLMVAAAAREGSEGCTKLLLQRGAAVQKRSIANDSALLFAALNGNLNAAGILLDAGAELNGQHELLDTALHTAAREGHELVCRMLLERGADVDPRNETGDTPLALTVDEPDNKSLVELFLSHHANINSQNGEGFTVLHKAISTECKDSTVVELLLWRGADVTEITEEGYTALHVAAANGNSNILGCLVQAGANPSVQSTSGLTALHLAVRHDVEAAEVLIKAGCPVNIQNSIGQTPLHMAVVASCTNVVEYLLHNGALVDSKDECGQVAAYFAAVDGAEDIMLLLLRYGAQANERESTGMTLLHVAASHGHSKIIELLIRNGAKVDIRDEYELTPFIMACENGHTGIAQQLLARGADINAYGGKDEAGWNSLFFAAQDNHLAVVQMLLSKGIDRRSPLSEQEWTPLHSASGNGYLEIVRTLVDTGDYNLNVAAGPIGLSPLHFAAMKQDHEMISLLLDRGAAIEIRSKKGFTPLYIACSLKEIEATAIVRFLIDQGADCFTKDNDGLSCLHMAARWALPATIEVLLDRGIDVNVKGPDRCRPLQAAIQAEMLENVRTLITRGADIHIVDDEGSSYLHEACKIGCKEICRLLLDEGAKVDGINRNAETPLHVAITAPHPLIARLLLERGADMEAQDKDGCSVLARAVWNAVLARQFAMESSARLAKLAHADAGEGTFPGQRNLEENTVDYLGDTKELAKSEADELTMMTKRRADHVSMVQILLQMGADVSRKDTNQCTMLNHAAYHADLEITTILIEAGADIRAGEDVGCSPFISAVWSGDIEYVQAILTLTNYNLNDQSRATNTPLGEALCTGDIPMFHFLRSKGANLETENVDGETALFAALRKDNASELIAILLNEGSDPNVRANDGTPAIFPAVLKVNTDILELFLSKGADFGVSDFENDTALHWAMEPHLLETVTWLLGLNVIDVNAKDDQGRTALLMAAALGYIEHATLLIDHSADIENSDSSSTTPLIAAATGGHLQLVQLLLDRGASVGAQDRKCRDSLSYAANNGFEKIVKALLEYGGNSNMIDAGGRPALQYAANRGHEGVVKLLIEHGADVKATTKKGSTAAAAARAGGYEELAVWIQKLIDTGDQSEIHSQLVDRTVKR